MKYITSFILLFTLLAFVLFSCGPEENGAPEEEEEELSSFEQTHGIGPITEEMDLPDELDMNKVEQGEQIFRSRCSSCHRMEGRHVGPPLGAAADTRSPEWIMNFTLNPRENIQRHPRGEALLREYLTEMPQQNVDEDQTRAILEYLRYEAEQR